MEPGLRHSASLIARYTAGCLGTAQKEPLVLGPAPVGNKQTSVISYDGRSLPNLTPTTLRESFSFAGAAQDCALLYQLGWLTAEPM